MSKTEKYIIKFLKDNYTCLLWGAATVLGIILRCCCMGFISDDMTTFLLPWYKIIAEKGSASLASQVGDYNILYQTIIYLFTLLPLNPIFAYKLLSCIFDYALALTAAFLADGVDEDFYRRLYSGRFVAAYTAVLFCPVVFLNSSLWGQCDSIYSFFILASLFSLTRKRYRAAFILYGLAFAFKFQAVFALPFFLILYLISERFSIVKFLYIPVVLELSALPGILSGRSILSPFLIYLDQTSTYNAVSMNYPSFWNIPVMDWAGADGSYREFKLIAVIFTAAVLGILLLLVLRRQIIPTRETLTGLLHITVYTSVLFLPVMHERYGYLYEITGLILAFYNRKYILPAVGLILLSCATYSYFLFGAEYPFLPAAVLNVMLYAWYLWLVFSETFSGRQSEGGIAL